MPLGRLEAIRCSDAEAGYPAARSKQSNRYLERVGGVITLSLKGDGLIIRDIQDNWALVLESPHGG
jgi:hypothetical protein